MPINVGDTKYGDFKPSFRVLTTVGQKMNFDIQTEFLMSGKQPWVGLRAKYETLEIGGHTWEINAGARAGNIKWPSIVTALYNAVK